MKYRESRITHNSHRIIYAQFESRHATPGPNGHPAFVDTLIERFQTPDVTVFVNYGMGIPYVTPDRQELLTSCLNARVLNVGRDSVLKNLD